VPGSAKIHWGVARLKFIENKKQQGKNGIAPELNGSGAFFAFGARRRVALKTSRQWGEM
jgi:hypothetical protein